MPEAIQAVKAKHTASLMAMPGVVSVGIGRDADGAAVIVVGIDRDRAETRAAIPKELDGYRVKVEPVGSVRAQ